MDGAIGCETAGVVINGEGLKCNIGPGPDPNMLPASMLGDKIESGDDAGTDALEDGEEEEDEEEVGTPVAVDDDDDADDDEDEDNEDDAPMPIDDTASILDG